jgi:hypothetical protein
MASTLDAGGLATVAAMISSFCAVMLVFRIQRETEMAKAGERQWLPLADWLLVGAALVSLLLVILPLTAFVNTSLPVAASGSAAILVAGYIFAILAHYRIWFDRNWLF